MAEDKKTAHSRWCCAPLRHVVGRRSILSSLSKNTTKILFLKLTLCAFLIAAAVATTVLVYNKSTRTEHEKFEGRFDSVGENALAAVVGRLQQMDLGIQELSSTYSHMFSNASSWPNVAWTGFHPTATLLGKVSSVEGMAIMPIVQPDQVSAYENFINAYYDTDKYCNKSYYFNPYYPNGEIYGLVNNTALVTEFYLDRFGNTTASPNQILAPLAQYTMSLVAGPYQANVNVHGHPLYTAAIDGVISCATSKAKRSSALTSCGTISPGARVPYAVEANPHPVTEDVMAVFFHPIYAADDEDTLVGFAAGTLSWRELLKDVIAPDTLGIDCVIEADNTKFTFHIRHGMPTFKGMGALYSSRYNHIGRSSHILGSDVSVAVGKPYILHFYPTTEYEAEFHTIAPLRGALILAGLFVFCSFLFGSYDILTQREFDRNQAVLDTKRRFVRFISHEIRTPLNTVRLGMKLIEVEMGKFTSSLGAIPQKDLAETIRSALRSWKHLADEIVESSESAVEVLNDLLNYDKIELGTLKLEFSYVDMRTLTEKVCAAMQVQAQQKEINLELNCFWHRALLSCSADSNEATTNNLPDEDRTVVGDGVRLGQVLRNLISNALKFTPLAGDVIVTGRCILL
jgi:hypothetical protein